MILGLSRRLTNLGRAAAAGVLMLAATPVAAGDAMSAWYERSFVLAADARCGLFQPALTAALNASALQARGAALRAGASDLEVRATADRARARAASTPCASPDLQTVRGRVQTGFAGWTRTRSMRFPGGPGAGWSADRAAYARPTWRLMQGTLTGASPVRFGVVGGLQQPDALVAAVSWHGRPRPTGARLVMRDPSVAARPWLSASAPPAAQSRVIWASASAAADPGLLVAGRTEGQAWRFPAHAADALARLDPRERFVVEFLFRDGSIARATFEAGDFPAARAFLAMGVV